jgi:phage-related holin
VLGGNASLCRAGVIGFYPANEGLSILENAGRLGLPLPAFLREALRQLREKSDNPQGGGKNETV